MTLSSLTITLLIEFEINTFWLRLKSGKLSVTPLEEVHTAKRGIGKDDYPECLGQLFGQSVNQAQCKLRGAGSVRTPRQTRNPQGARVVSQ